MVDFDFDTLEHRLRELAFLNSGVEIQLFDKRLSEPKRVDLHYQGGIAAFVGWLDRSKHPLIEAPIAIAGEKNDIVVEVAMQWNDSYHENMLCFTNNIPQRDGERILAGFLWGLNPPDQWLCPGFWLDEKRTWVSLSW